MCFGLLVLLLILGESTLPLFGGDRALAARAYKTIFMGLGAGCIAGLAVYSMQRMALFGRSLMIRYENPPAHLAPAVWLLENGQGWVFLFFVGAGGVLGTYIWLTEV